jgi:hypothetical protein
MRKCWKCDEVAEAPLILCATHEVEYNSGAVLKRGERERHGWGIDRGGVVHAKTGGWDEDAPMRGAE